MKVEKTFTSTIHCGLKVRNTGELKGLDFAKDIIQRYVDGKGECVSVTETTYMYTNGFEQGIIVEFIQYPRFTRDPEQILYRALQLAEKLMIECEQYRVSVLTSEKTFMLENNLLDHNS